MADRPLIAHIHALGTAVFSTRELCAVSGRSPSVVSQGLAYLVRQGLVYKVMHGVWAAARLPSQYELIPYVLPKHRAYVSFLSALHLHGIIEQIPQEVALASTAHSREIRTAAGAFAVHHIAASFYSGFGWAANGRYLLAEPEKALVDCLYISAFRKRQFSHFPELNFPREFSFNKAHAWVKAIKNTRTAEHVRQRLAAIIRS